MARLKTLAPAYLDKLIGAGQPIYVLNTSCLPSGDKCSIVVNFLDGNRREFFKMPPTFIPMAISDAIPLETLAKCRDLKVCLMKGTLTLVEPESAMKFLATPDAQDEYEALVYSEHSAKAHNINVEAEVNKRVRVAHQSSPDVGGGPVQNLNSVDTVSNRVRGLIESMISEELTPREVLVQMRRHQSALSTVDFSYVVANSSDKELTTWARKAMAKASVDEVEEEEEEEFEFKPKKKLKAKAKTTKKKTKKSKSNEPVFDFSNADHEMTPEERKADMEAQQRAMAQQAVDGRSRVNEEINKIMSGDL